MNDFVEKSVQKSVEKVLKRVSKNGQKKGQFSPEMSLKNVKNVSRKVSKTRFLSVFWECSTFSHFVKNVLFWCFENFQLSRIS